MGTAVAAIGTFPVFALSRTKQNITVSNMSVCLKMTRIRMTHMARLLGPEKSECIIFEAWVPPTPGTNGEVLFFAIWCLPLKNRKKYSEYILDKSVKSEEISPTTDR